MTRRAVVTGASSGIGAATARELARRGWQVLGVARRAERLRELAAEGIEYQVVDVTSQGDVDELARRLAPDGVDALVNNAGGARGVDSVEAGSIDDWRWMYEVNVLGFKRVVTALLPLLRARARLAGHADILAVTSTAGHGAYVGGGGYNAAKFAQHAVCDVLRLELNGEPIRVTEVAPGLVATKEFSFNRLGGNRRAADAVYAGVDRPLSAEDVAVTISDALERPAHVVSDLIVLRPLAQAATTVLHRGPLAVRDDGDV
ncbi:MAG TPA: SDR family oxidoreductase [Microbacteriaceae bacterium]|nr:SDR family oxidoreductase [Microbacteriaceae bacterium]